jgi:hypothetical protein
VFVALCGSAVTYVLLKVSHQPRTQQHGAGMVRVAQVGDSRMADVNRVLSRNQIHFEGNYHNGGESIFVRRSDYENARSLILDEEIRGHFRIYALGPSVPPAKDDY